MAILKNHIYFLFFTFVVLLSACKDKQLEQEVVTTVKIKLTDSAGNAKTFTWEKKDPNSAAAPVVDTIKLVSNKVYTGELTILNASVNPVIDLTQEIRDKKADHLFVFRSASSSLKITITDLDANQKPVGLTTTWIGQAIGTANVNILLKHLPNKTAASPETTGSTDIDATFPIKVQ
jgi:small nuclear ribonucleoprotein (snRNP)-like protein